MAGLVYKYKKTVAYSFFFCSRFTPRRQPAAWELHFTRNSTTNIAHGENEGTKERNSVSLWAFFFFFFFSSAHAAECTTCCGATIAVCELELMDGSEPSLGLL